MKYLHWSVNPPESQLLIYFIHLHHCKVRPLDEYGVVKTKSFKLDVELRSGHPHEIWHMFHDQKSNLKREHQ